MRIETDSIGPKALPCSAYYGIHSLRAKENFPLSNDPLHPILIKKIAQIKLAAARVNAQSNQLSPKKSEAIIAACTEIILGNFHTEFIVPAIQGGAGTSANMNANEVIANLALEKLGFEKGSYKRLHPNDHVNMCQSTNDVFPTAGKLTFLELLLPLKKNLTQLIQCFQQKALESRNILKMARTQLQDAVPTTGDRMFDAYAHLIRRELKRVELAEKELHILNLGGTAIGNSINATKAYIQNIIPELSKVTGVDLVPALDLVDATQNLDGFMQLSHSLKGLAISLSKISNDLRLLSSGPTAGLQEIMLPKRQSGSSIMPGKVNPVIPEVISQVAYHVIGTDTTVTMAVEAGQLELNAFEPIIFHDLFQSIELLTQATQIFRTHCIEGIFFNEQHCQQMLESSPVLAVVLAPHIGYEQATNLVQKAHCSGKTIPDLLTEELHYSPEEVKTMLIQSRYPEQTSAQM